VLKAAHYAGGLLSGGKGCSGGGL